VGAHQISLELDRACSENKHDFQPYKAQQFRLCLITAGGASSPSRRFAQESYISSI